LATLVVGLFGLSSPLEGVATSSAATTQTTISDSGFQPASQTVQPGDNITFTSQASGPQTVTSDEGLFDSGSLPPGAGFSMAIAVPGDHGYRSTNNPALKGVIHVAAPLLAGPPTDLANNHVPNVLFPDSSAADISRSDLAGSRHRSRSGHQWHLVLVG
jgi:plastocyanin